MSENQGPDKSSPLEILEHRYCSWCFDETTHVLADQSRLSRNTYICQTCQNQTLSCRVLGCTNMTKGPPNNSPDGFFAGIAENWHDECCAEHDGTVASFQSLRTQLEDISQYRTILEGDTWNWSSGGKIAAGVVGGAVAAAPAAFLAAPGIASALGSWGLLGTASTGTAISTLSGAALTNASLAAIGGGAVATGGIGIAGGTILLAAAGGALGGVRGGVIANSYFSQIKDFDISSLSPGSENVVFVNGFLQQGDQNFDDWRSGCSELHPETQAYGVTWESKTLLDLGTTLVGAGRGPILKFMESVVRRSSRSAIQKVNPLNWADILLGLFDNPWHNAMAKAGMTGILLADILSRTGNKRYTLMGHSLGARVLFYTLTNLSMKPGSPVDNVYLLGGAVDRLDTEDWQKAASAVSGKIYNCYSKNDSVLKYLYQGANPCVST